MSISYVDSLFLVVSAMTEAGLNTVNLSQMTTWQQVLLWLLIIIGSSIWVSIWTVVIRKHAFERRFEEIVKRERQRSHERRNASLTLLPIAQRFKSLARSRNASGTATASLPLSESTSHDRKGAALLPISSPTDRRLISAVIPQRAVLESETEGHRPISGDDATGRGYSEYAASRTSEHVTFVDEPLQRAVSSSIHQIPGVMQRRPSNVDTSTPNLTATTTADEGHYRGTHKVGRNAQFHGLTSEEREKLGGTEYRALRLLSVIVPIYFVSWQFFGSVALGAWIANNQPQPALDNAISPWWNGIFNGVSAFNNSGSKSIFFSFQTYGYARCSDFKSIRPLDAFSRHHYLTSIDHIGSLANTVFIVSVLDLNMIPYGGSYFVLIVMGAMILAGNTAYPVFLRLCIWCSLNILNHVSYAHDFVEWKATLEYILKYPRRVYTNLFPQRQTWWLVFMLFVLNGTDWVAFEILNLGNPSLSEIRTGSRVIDGLFQAIGKQPTDHPRRQAIMLTRLVAVRSGGF